jgi:hypothetical protein
MRAWQPATVLFHCPLINDPLAIPGACQTPRKVLNSIGRASPPKGMIGALNGRCSRMQTAGH